MTLRINEIFYSIQGESTFAGLPCIFIRLTGCNVRCAWCDTSYAFEGSNIMTLDAIIEETQKYPCQLVEITGGEPMLQSKNACRLMTMLIELGYKVLLETNGQLPLDDVPKSVCRIIDLKAPTSGVKHIPVLWFHFSKSWQPTDEIKCVVGNREDFDWCVEKLVRYGAFGKTTVSFSAVWGKLPLATLVTWLCEGKYPMRLNPQLHKFIWDPATRGV